MNLVGQKDVDKFARILALISLLLAGGNLYFTYHSSQRTDRTAQAAEAAATLNTQGYNYLVKLSGTPYVFEDSTSVDAYIAQILPLYQDPLLYDHGVPTVQLGHDGVVARYRRFLQPLKSLVRTYRDVQVSANSTSEYRIAAIVTIDRTYFPGMQPSDCQAKTRFIQESEVDLTVIGKSSATWLVTKSGDTTRPGTSECRNPA